MGAASKGIIQRGYQHNATVYKTPYAKNPFDSVTDDEIKEYKRTVEKKRAGDCKIMHLILIIALWPWELILVTDTDYSESEAFSSLQISGQVKSPPMSHSEGMVLRIETTRAPLPSQPEVVLSDGELKILIKYHYQNKIQKDPQEKNFVIYQYFPFFIGFQCYKRS